MNAEIENDRYWKRDRPRVTELNDSCSSKSNMCQCYLRAPDQTYRESHDRNEISYSILFYQKYPFGKLFSKIIFKSSSAVFFFSKI